MPSIEQTMAGLTTALENLTIVVGRLAPLVPAAKADAPVAATPAAKTTKASKPAPEAPAPAAPEAAPVAQAPDTELFEEVTAQFKKLATFSQDGKSVGRSIAMAVLDEFGVKMLSKVPPDQWQAALTRINDSLAALDA